MPTNRLVYLLPYGISGLLISKLLILKIQKRKKIVVAEDTNEETTVAAHLTSMDLKGLITVGDAAHAVKANCRQITQIQGGDYLFFFKGNPATAIAKAKQLLAGSFPPQAPSLDKAHGRLEDRNL